MKRLLNVNKAILVLSLAALVQACGGSSGGTASNVTGVGGTVCTTTGCSGVGVASTVKAQLYAACISGNPYEIEASLPNANITSVIPNAIATDGTAVCRMSAILYPTTIGSTAPYLGPLAINEPQDSGISLWAADRVSFTASGQFSNQVNSGINFCWNNNCSQNTCGGTLNQVSSVLYGEIATTSVSFPLNGTTMTVPQDGDLLIGFNVSSFSVSCVQGGPILQASITRCVDASGISHACN